eukprot:COSAG06_NODE_1109_length_10653_cov_103.721148_4_plen_181_part_00
MDLKQSMRNDAGLTSPSRVSEQSWSRVACCVSLPLPPPPPPPPPPPAAGSAAAAAAAVRARCHSRRAKRGSSTLDQNTLHHTATSTDMFQHDKTQTVPATKWTPQVPVQYDKKTRQDKTRQDKTRQCTHQSDQAIVGKSSGSKINMRTAAPPRRPVHQATPWRKSHSDVPAPRGKQQVQT